MLTFVTITARCESGRAFASLMECYEKHANKLLCRSSTDDRQIIALCAMLAACIEQSNLLKEDAGEFCKSLLGIHRWHPSYAKKVVEDFETNVDKEFLVSNAHEVMMKTINEFPSIPGCKEGNCIQWHLRNA